MLPWLMGPIVGWVSSPFIYLKRICTLICSHSAHCTKSLGPYLAHLPLLSSIPICISTRLKPNSPPSTSSTMPVILFFYKIHFRMGLLFKLSLVIYIWISSFSYIDMIFKLWFTFCYISLSNLYVTILLLISCYEFVTFDSQIYILWFTFNSYFYFMIYI